MAKKRSRLADYAVYLLVRCCVCVLQALSWSAALTLARALAWLAYHVNRRHRAVAADNLRHAYPHWDEGAVDRLVRECYLHFVTVAIEMMRMPRTLTRANLPRHVQHAGPNDLEHIHRWVSCGRPVMVLTGHLGNWEVLSYVTGLFGCAGGIIARRLDNPHLDRLVARLRGKTGLEILDKSADYTRILEILQRGGGLGMVGDQDAGPRGLFVSFFDRPASTFKSIALLSLEYAAPIVVVSTVRIGHPMYFLHYLEDVILPEEYATRADAARAITQRYTDALERMVRRHPEQYFWFHRRWKHQPAMRKARKAA